MNGYAGSVDKTLRQLAKTETLFHQCSKDALPYSGGQPELLASAVAYFEGAIALLQALSSEKVHSLKLPGRAWKRIVLPIMHGSFEPVSVERFLLLAKQFYRESGETGRLCELLRLQILTLGQISAYPEAVREYSLALENDQNLWPGLYQICSVCDRLLDAVKLFVYLDPESCLAPPSSPKKFEEYMLLLASVKKSFPAPTTVAALFLQRAKQLYTKKEHLSEFIESTALILLLLPDAGAHKLELAVELFCKMTEALKNFTPAKPYMMAWTLCMIKMVQMHGCARLLDFSTIIWTCETLNQHSPAYKSKGTVLDATISPLASKQLTASQLVEFKISSDTASLLKEAIVLCQDDRVSGFISWNGKEFRLGPILLEKEQDTVPYSSQEAPATAIVQEQGGEKDKDFSQGCVEKISAEIATLKLKKETLSQLEEASCNEKRPGNISKSLFVLDTNVLIDKSDQIQDLIAFRDIYLGIPLLVRVELDGLLKSSRKKRVERVLELFRALEEHSVPELATVRGLAINGTTVDCLRGGREVWPSDPLVRSIDDAILHAASLHGNAVVVSDDINMMLKGESQGVFVLSWAEFLNALQSM